MLLGDLIAGLPVKPSPSASLAVRVCDITEDSRTVVPGSLFVARAGIKADGRRFIDDAVRRGAVAILTDAGGAVEAGAEQDPGERMVLAASGASVLFAGDVSAVGGALAERFYGMPSRRLTIAAVTGTNGKSTITYLIWRLLNGADRRCGLIGTVLIDDGREVAPASMTTPPAIELSRTLSTMADAGCVACAMEASSHALDQKRVDAVSLSVGIFTNLTGDHLDYHGTMESYASAKARLFESLPPEGVAIVNADDPWHERMLRGCRARVIRCAVEPAPTDGGALEATDRPRADARVSIVREGVDGMTLRLSGVGVVGGAGGVIEGSVPLIGGYNAMNVLQAVCAARCMGLTAEQIASSLPLLSAPPGRLEPAVAADAARGGSEEFGAARAAGFVVAARLPRVYVDYAHSDDSLRNVLKAVRGSMRAGGSDGRLWVVFGCGGDRDRTKRPRMGLAAIDLADRVVVTSDNPRSEDPGAIVKEILAGIPSDRRDRVTVHVERDRAIEAAVLDAGEHDVIVIAGKGHETDQIRKDASGALVRHHFDDREHASRALASRLRRVTPPPGGAS